MSESEAPQPAQTPYEILGDQGIKDLVAAFYDIMDSDPDAQEIRAMHADDLGPVDGWPAGVSRGHRHGVFDGPSRGLSHRSPSAGSMAKLHVPSLRPHRRI